MLKKAVCSPVSGFIVIATGATLFVQLTGPPRTPLSLLGNLSLMAIFAILTFFFISSCRYRPQAPAGTGALALLIATLGVVIILLTLIAAIFGMSAVHPYVGVGCIALLSAIAMSSVKDDG